MNLPRAVRAPLVAAAIVSLGALAPRWVCGRAAASFVRGDAEVVDPLARAVSRYGAAGVSAAAFHTGSARFDGEWAYGTEVMSVLGLSQAAMASPTQAGRHAHDEAIARGVARLLSRELRAFGAAAWGADALTEPATGGHAYMGYAALALSMARLHNPSMPGARTHDALIELLAARLDASPHGVFETYPGEAYPPDVAMVVGAIALHARASGRPADRRVARAVARLADRYVDASTGLLWQAADAASGAPRDAPRASGTALAAYALAFADAALSRRLSDALGRCTTVVLGFGVVRETCGGDGRRDIDSGPVILGASVSATGFSLASARMTGDDARFTALLRTTHLFGVPVTRGDATRFMTGGPLGNAILLAMLTAGPGSLLGEGAR